MSDFIYSRRPAAPGQLRKEIQKIYQQNKLVNEFHGPWGSLAVSSSLYNGFQPYETNEHIFVVIGGPVLCFQDNKFLMEEDEVAGARAIYNYWRSNDIHWDKALSGPFVILIINKSSGEITCVTDLMAFIPVYLNESTTNVMISTHVDALARAANQHEKTDLVSQVDFILHGVVTYPFTCYANLRQLAPATAHTWTGNRSAYITSAYWTPEEKDMYTSLSEAAGKLRKSLQEYVDTVVEKMPHVAQFISGGEDSRTISGLLSPHCKRDAFVFLEEMNREGKIAKKAAEAYGANFKMATRSPIHYLEILPACSDLVGSSSEYRHVHTYGYHKICKLDKYPAVFGGLYADALLKGSRVVKLRQLVFLPPAKDDRYSPATPIQNKLFSKGVLAELTKRRQAHLDYIKTFRQESAEEWFELWPSSMNRSIPNIHGNRRLFRSYEPFLSKDIVKLSARIPQKWKLNRLLFNKATKPFLKQTKWLLHSDGRLPYFPWYINNLVSFPPKFFRKLREVTGLSKKYQGPWYDWNVILASEEWKNTVAKYTQGNQEIESLLEDKDVKKLFTNREFDKSEQLNFIQTLHINYMNKQAHEHKELLKVP